MSRTCAICGAAFTVIVGSGCCSANCKRVYNSRYRQRVIEARCSVCLAWRRTTYNAYKQLQKRKGGACYDCDGTGDKLLAAWREVEAEPDDSKPLVWRKIRCGTCQHGRPEPAAWTGYWCAANAVLCQPRREQRLYKAAR